jgi:hypothetical protein
MPWRRLVWWEIENFMSYWPPGLTRHRNRQSDPARTSALSSASIIAIGAVLTAFVILGTLALHRDDSSAEDYRWTTPLPTDPLIQPALPEPVPVLPAPSSSAPAAVTVAPATHRTSPPPPRRTRPADPTPAPLIPAAGSRISLIPAGDSGLRLRHRDFRLRLDRIGPRSSAVDRADATFVVRSGLADKSCVSLEAVNFPGRFVRHQDFALFLHPRQPSALFAADATFCPQRVGSAGEFVLRAVNYPDRHLAVRDSSVRLSRVPVADAQRFRTAAGL